MKNDIYFNVGLPTLMSDYLWERIKNMSDIYFNVFTNLKISDNQIIMTFDSHDKRYL